jgi:anti-repressor protein
MNELMVVKNVRVYIDEVGVAQINAEDAARGLGFTQEKNGIQYVRWETINNYLSSFRFSQLVGKDDFIPEGMFYRLAMKASNETAMRFQDMVADDILPSIRKTGSYTAMIPQTFSEALRLCAAEIEKREAAEGRLALAAPKIEFFDTIADCKDATDMGRVAKALNFTIGGRTNLFRFLREKEILMGNNVPYQRYVDASYFRVIVSTYNKPDGSTHASTKTLVYTKGMDFIRRTLIAAGYSKVEAHN